MTIEKKQGLLAIAVGVMLSVAALMLLPGSTTTAVAAKPTPPPPPPPPDVTYGIQWLDLEEAYDVFDPATDIVPRKLNNRGDVVGFTGRAYDPEDFGWVYTAQTGTFDMSDVVLPPDDESSIDVRYCNGINDNRQIVGGCIYGGRRCAFRLALPLNEDGTLSIDPGTGLPFATRVQILPPPADSVGEYLAVNINSYGDVLVCWDTGSGAANRVSLYVSDADDYIHTSANRHPDWRPGVIDDGGVVGTHKGSDGRAYGFRSALDVTTGVETDFGTLPGFVAPSSAESFVSQISGHNNVGLVVGAALKSVWSSKGRTGTPATLHAFVYADDMGMVDLGTLGSDANSHATSINDRGDVVGTSGNATSGTLDGGRPFLWTPESRMYELNRLVGADATGRWSTATAIRPHGIREPREGQRFGQIYGRATVGGRARPFRPTPSGI